MGTRKTDGKNNEIDEGQRRRNLAPKSYAADEYEQVQQKNANTE